MLAINAWLIIIKTHTERICEPVRRSQVVVAQGQVQLHRAVAEQPARAVPRPRQDAQGRQLGARHARHPRLLRYLLLRGDHRVKGPRRLHGRRPLGTGGQHEQVEGNGGKAMTQHSVFQVANDLFPAWYKLK